jgi:hypothetical protein
VSYRSCYGIEEYVQWYTAIAASSLGTIVVHFFVRSRVYVVLSIVIAFGLSMAPMFRLWILGFDSENAWYAAEVWRVRPGSGILANAILTAGVLGFFGLIIFARKDENGPPRGGGMAHRTCERSETSRLAEAPTRREASCPAGGQSELPPVLSLQPARSKLKPDG